MESFFPFHYSFSLCPFFHPLFMPHLIVSVMIAILITVTIILNRHNSTPIVVALVLPYSFRFWWVFSFVLLGLGPGLRLASGRERGDFRYLFICLSIL
jgi:hypothetical protein